MPKILSVVGPTGSGKTAFAIKIAPLMNGALISVDSRQVYQKLDVISGKDLEEDSEFKIQNSELDFNDANYQIGYYTFDNNTRIYLIDIVPPSYNFTVNDFVQICSLLISKISKIYTPILVGGTGFYFNALFSPIDTIQIPPDQKLRDKLEQKSLEEVQLLLKKEDPLKFESMNNSDRKNKRRLIRAIEIYRGKTIRQGLESQGRRLTRQGLIESSSDVLKIGLTAPRDVIKQRIDDRVRKRLEQGAVDEAESLYKNYSNLSVGVKDANGYKQLFEYFQRKYSLDEAIERWKQSEYLNAKKQNTWFKRDAKIHWFDVSESNFQTEATDYVLNWYNTS